MRSSCLGVPFPGFGTIIGLMLLLFGILFSMLGVVSEYMGLIYEEVKQRPNFVVRRKIGSDGSSGAGLRRLPGRSAPRSPVGWRRTAFSVVRTSRGARGLHVDLDDFSALSSLERAATRWCGRRAPTSTTRSPTSTRAQWDEVLHGNVTFVAATLAELLRLGKIADGARLVVLSSIWERQARQDKFSYTVSKAAVAGLVRSAAVDLAPRGILINGVLPGVTDTPMTRGLLSGEQIDAFGAATGFGRLASLDDVANTVVHLCSHAQQRHHRRVAGR